MKVDAIQFSLGIVLSRLALLCVLPHPLLSLVLFRFMAFLPLHHAHDSSHLLLVRFVPFSLLFQAFPSHEVSILSQLAKSALPFLLMLGLELAQF